MKILPLESNLPDYQFTTILDGVEVGFRLRWNDRASAWYMGIFDAAGDLIIDSVQLSLNRFIGIGICNDGFPPGVFFVFDNSGSNVEATLEDLGDRVLVGYFTEEEVLTL